MRLVTLLCSFCGCCGALDGSHYVGRSRQRQLAFGVSPSSIVLQKFPGLARQPESKERRARTKAQDRNKAQDREMHKTSEGIDELVAVDPVAPLQKDTQVNRSIFVLLFVMWVRDTAIIKSSQSITRVMRKRGLSIRQAARRLIHKYRNRRRKHVNTSVIMSENTTP